MKRLGLALVVVFPLSLLAPGYALAADDTKMKVTTNRGERGSGKVQEGVELQGAGKAAEPPATSAWSTVMRFFTDPFEGGNQDRRFQLDSAR